MKRSGGCVLSADGMGNGDALQDVLVGDSTSMLGDAERRMIGDRTRAALAVKRRNGERLGRHAAIGYSLDDSGQQVPNYQERHLVQRVERLRERGLSYRGVVEALHAAGKTWRDDKAFTAPVVRRLALAAGQPGHLHGRTKAGSLRSMLSPAIPTDTRQS